MIEYCSRRQLLGSVGFSFCLAGCLGDSGADGSRDGESHDDDHDHEGDDSHDHDDDESHDHDHDHGHELGHPAPAIDVEMVSDDGHHLVPHAVHVEVGGTVEWISENGGHNAVAYHPENEEALPSTSERRIPGSADPFETELLDAGDAVERSFDVEGVYDYACTPHEDAGMVGRIIVGEPDIADEAAMSEPSEEMDEAAAEQFRAFNERTRDAFEDGH